jgi:hypothetical protein
MLVFLVQSEKYVSIAESVDCRIVPWQSPSPNLMNMMYVNIYSYVQNILYPFPSIPAPSLAEL